MIKVKEYSGHIRNWKALCEELKIAPDLSREVREEMILLKGYETWGYDIGHHLYGMFAFALWDEEEKKLFCMRDHFGTKPFYYYETADGEILCSTSIRRIIEQPGFVKELNEEMLQIYMSLTYVAGENTFFRGLKKLMPGRYLIWQDRKMQIERYWTPQFCPDESKTLEDWADEIHSTIREIMPEVKEENEEAESFLSGGVDSSYVLAMSDVTRTDSCGYEEERFDESGLARQTADVLGRENTKCLITPEEYFDIVPYVMYNMEQPLGDASAIAFALACQATAKHTKLCYSGEGADEFFGGYNMYRNAERYGENLKTFYVGNTNIMKEDEKRRILKKYDPDVLPIELVQGIYEETEGLDPLSKMSDVDIQIWLEGDIYLNVDKMSTAAGLEIRMPLTDRRIFDIASRMPSRYKVDSEQNKVAFRTAAAKVLPKEIAFRKKLGFIVPIRIWMADERYNQDVREKFHSDIAEKFFHVEEIQAIFDDYVGGNSDNWRKVWTIYTFLVWYEEYFVKR
ncbi:asparagine synthase (glutamine-hydrolyzing) [Faecalicatena acetigenes]|uniref:asparagine synthase (glutamine-hydrolyzing) n=1 Tax=Faecalicatena acetigenes TaxID=2981790 RepID=A0ABT2T766_9FIRM|nr:asparagine synthase (glutamine-hydrolyzing) [Faecalicatena acetigenes]MCU6746095.1 asparagine synthase (glutamine-hydrolyzing) [Faecalicatena acetigenes]SCG94762.1 Asparagine synthetase [glutamine-hydrolyzing] 1 [uncultured Clostridium sp.]